MLFNSRCFLSLLLVLWLLPSLSQSPSTDALEALLQGGSGYEKAQRVRKYAQNLPLGEKITLLELARTILRDRQISDGEAEINVGLGIAHYHSGAYPEALKYYQAAIDLYDNTEDWGGLGRCYNEMAILVNKQNDAERALEYLDRSAELCLRGGDSICWSTSYDNRGLVYRKQERWEEAEQNYRKALAIRLQIRDSIGLGYVYNNLGEIASIRGNIPKAIEWVAASTQIRQLLGDTLGQAINKTNMGELYFQQGNYRRASQYFEESLIQSRRLAFLDLSSWNLEFASKCYAKLDETDLALDYLRQSYAIKDSILSTKRIEELAEMETRFETEKKEQQIVWQQKELELQGQRFQARLGLILAALLVLSLLGAIGFLTYRNRQQALIRDNELSFQQELLHQTISVQEKERKRIAKDLHDGIGQQLTGLKMAWQNLEEEVSAIDGSQGEKLVALRQVLDGTADEVRELSHQMMPRALSELGLVAALEDLVDKTFRGQNIEAELSHHRLDERLPETIEVNVYRIIQELINNTIKHAKASELDLQLLGQDNHLLVIVEDNGLGFSPSEIDPHSQGMVNINSRVRALDGSVDFQSEKGKGTLVTLRIPLQRTLVSS